MQSMPPAGPGGRSRRRLLLLPVAVLAAVLGGALSAAGIGPAEVATAPSATTGAAPTDPVTVTLVTGDRVTLVPSGDGQPEVIFDPAPGSEPAGFDVLRDGTNVQVVPDDVASLVPDLLDPALFDVTALVEMGYDDQNAEALPLIVRQAPGMRSLAASALQHTGSLSSIGASAVELNKADAADFGDRLAADQAGVTKIWLDRKVAKAELDGYLTQVGAPSAWDAGLDGAGVTVAVLDTGVDDGHPALAGQVGAHTNFTDEASAADGNGHGTHVASVLAGTGAGADGARQGIAPGVDLLSGKVLDDEGFGQASWAIAGMEWAVDQGADIVNLSFGGPPTATDDPLVETLEALTEQSGTLFVAAAGNRGGFGGSPFTIETPGSAASALTVGAVTGTDALAVFSSQGPTLGTYRLKPDVAAPGVSILGARAGARDTDLYLPMSGTSQATPIVAGAAALLMQQHPDWNWQQIKTQIVGTADQYEFQTSWSHGGGRLDLDQATGQDLTADAATLDFGYLRYPDAAPRTRTVTLTNDGAAPVSVDITADVRDNSGAPAGEGALAASPASLTVPAGGTAETTVTLDPALLEDGLWQGGMSFAAGDTTLLRLPFGVYDEPERYDLEVQVLDRNGEPYDPATGAGHPFGDTTIPIFNGDNGFFYRLQPDENGYVSERVAPGSYSIFARIITPAGGGEPETFTIAGTAGLVVDSDTSYVIDARDAQRLEPPTVSGQPTEARQAVGVTYSRHSDTRGYTEFGFFDPQEVAAGQFYVTPTEPVRSGTFEATFRWRLAPTGKIKPASPDAYELLLAAPTFPDPLSPTLTKRDVAGLARVDTTYHPVGQPGEYPYSTLYQTTETGIGFVYRAPLDVPATRSVLMTAEPNVWWGHCLAVPANGNAELCTDFDTYQPRERVAAEFGALLHPGVFEARHSASSMFVRAGLADGEHTSPLAFSAVESSTLSLFKDGELVDRRDGGSGFFPLANEPGRFRLEQEWTLLDAFTRSRQARTVWTFDSAPPTDPSQGFSTTPPLLTLGFGADLDELGQASARRPLQLDLQAGHLSAAEGSRIEEMQLWWSVDAGDTWHQSSTRRTGAASFTGTVPGTALQPGGDVSLRAVATDSAGNQVDQTVLGIIPVQ